MIHGAQARRKLSLYEPDPKYWHEHHVIARTRGPTTPACNPFSYKLTPMEILLASGNAHKLRELEAQFIGTGLFVQAANPKDLEGVEESAPSFVENALIKARSLSEKTGKPTLADDSGLVVPCLDGAPGVYSSRYCGNSATDAQNNAKLVRELGRQGLTVEQIREDPSTAPEAFFYCILVYLEGPRYPTPLMCEGVWRGRILIEPRGVSGFGYDPHFLPEGSDRTAAELTLEEKNLCSHRGQACRAMRHLLVGE